MAYLLNSVDILTYGIKAGQVPGSNIAVKGCFDLPARIGKTYHQWDDRDGIQPYVATSEIMFGGRDIELHGGIIGNINEINNYLKALYDAVRAFTDVVTLSTPYGNFSVYVKDIKPVIYNGLAKIVITFREPVATLTGGTLPAAAENAYTVDGIPLSSFGLYYEKGSQNILPDLKEQMFTKYGAESYQITRRKNKTFPFNCLLQASGLSDLQSKVQALYLLFKSSGTRNIKLGDYLNVDCFATEGFSIEDILIGSNEAYGRLRMNLVCYSINPVNELATDGGELITTDEGVQILV